MGVEAANTSGPMAPIPSLQTELPTMIRLYAGLIIIARTHGLLRAEDSD